MQRNFIVLELKSLIISRCQRRVRRTQVRSTSCILRMGGCLQTRTEPAPLRRGLLEVSAIASAPVPALLRCLCKTLARRQFDWRIPEASLTITKPSVSASRSECRDRHCGGATSPATVHPRGSSLKFAGSNSSKVPPTSHHCQDPILYGTVPD